MQLGPIIYRAVDILRAWFSEKGVTQAQFAERIDVHISSVSQYLCGHTTPPLDVFKRIVVETGLPCEKLLDYFLDLRHRKRGK